MFNHFFVFFKFTNKLNQNKSEMETRGLKVNINKTKLMEMGREVAVRQARGHAFRGLLQRCWSKLSMVSMLLKVVPPEIFGAKKSEKSRR